LSEQPVLPAPCVDPDAVFEALPGIWIIPDGGVPLVPNIGIILGDDAALVVDCGMGPANGQAVLDVARRLAGNRRLFLTLTHFHPEHGFGAQSFADGATIIYNAAQRDELATKGPGYLAMFGDFGPAAVAALEGTRLVSPHIAYHGARCDLDLGGRMVELHACGMAHTAGDQIVFLRRERVLFSGDLAENGMFPIFPWFPPDDVNIDGPAWIATLAACEAMRPVIVVPGHGPVGDEAILAAVRGYLNALSAEVAMRIESGETIDTIVATTSLAIIMANPTWQAPEWVGHAIRYFFQLHQRRTRDQPA
jgi:glyoxylase-like metal-dependent hydrolase (beta-lactamase superfamily II)